MTLSAEQKATVRQLAADGKSGAQIAAIIGGISRGAAIAVARRMGLKLHGANRGTTWTPERIAQLRQLWMEGHSSKIIAERMATTQKAIFQRRSVLKLPRRSTAEMNRLCLRGAVARRAESRKVKPATFRHERPLPPTSSPVSLLARREDQCAWVIGETKGPATMFCGAPTKGEACWCEYHSSVGFMKPYVRFLRVPEGV